MRTKTLLLVAALSAAGIATSMAQSNVYSLNVVGYINVAMAPGGGLSLMSNPLDLDGTGANNTLNSVLSTNGWGSGAQMFAWDTAAGSWVGQAWNNLSKTWPTAPPTSVRNAIQPGKGFFVKPSAGVTNVTLVGNVLQGHLTIPFTAGVADIVSSKVPQSGTLTQLGLPVTAVGNVSRFAKWDSALQSWGTQITAPLPAPLHWSGAGGDVTLGVAEAGFLTPALTGIWTRDFTVQ